MCLLLVLCVLNARAGPPVDGGDAASSVQLPEDAPWVDENQVNALPGDGPSAAGDKTIAGRTTPSPSHAGASAHDTPPNNDVDMGVDDDDSPPLTPMKFAPAKSGV
jgi:hypothetical protein